MTEESITDSVKDRHSHCETETSKVKIDEDTRKHVL